MLNSTELHPSHPYGIKMKQLQFQVQKGEQNNIIVIRNVIRKLKNRANLHKR
jgi:hypothetical protein